MQNRQILVRLLHQYLVDFLVHKWMTWWIQSFRWTNSQHNEKLMLFSLMMMFLMAIDIIYPTNFYINSTFSFYFSFRYFWKKKLEIFLRFTFCNSIWTVWPKNSLTGLYTNSFTNLTKTKLLFLPNIFEGCNLNWRQNCYVTNFGNYNADIVPLLSFWIFQCIAQFVMQHLTCFSSQFNISCKNLETLKIVMLAKKIIRLQ